MEIFRHLARHRGYIWRAAKTDFRFQYAGTSLGVLWNVLNPLLLIVIYTFVFSTILRLRAGGDADLSYPLFLCAGLLPWLAFSQSLVLASSQLLRSAVYLRRMTVPPEVFVAKSVLMSTFGMGIVSVLIVAIAFFSGRPPSPALAFLPLLIAGLMLLALGFGLVLAVLRVYFRDVGEILRAVTVAWRWTMPIIYAEELVPERFRVLFDINPPYPFIRAIRSVLLGLGSPQPREIVLMAAWSVTGLLLGAFVFKRLSSGVRDIL